MIHNLGCQEDRKRKLTRIQWSFRFFQKFNVKMESIFNIIVSIALISIRFFSCFSDLKCLSISKKKSISHINHHSILNSSKSMKCTHTHTYTTPYSRKWYTIICIVHFSYFTAVVMALNIVSNIDGVGEKNQSKFLTPNNIT